MRCTKHRRLKAEQCGACDGVLHTLAIVLLLHCLPKPSILSHMSIAGFVISGLCTVFDPCKKKNCTAFRPQHDTILALVLSYHDFEEVVGKCVKVHRTRTTPFHDYL